MNRILYFSFALIPALTLCRLADAGVLGGQLNSNISAITEKFNKSNHSDPTPDFKIERSFDFKSNDYYEINKIINAKYTYPQGFYIDENKDLLFVLRYSNGKPARGVIEKYQWSSGVQLSTYIMEAPQSSISEGIVVDTTDDHTFAYIRSDNHLARFNLKDGENGFGSATKIKPLEANVGQSFYRKNGNWYVERFKTKKDTIGQSRGDYSILDSGFNHIGDITFQPEYTGYRESQRFHIPKHQGFAVLDDGYVMSMGGYWASPSQESPYTYFGINKFDNTGKISESRYVSPSGFAAQLLRLGVDVDRIENEGIQAMADGSVITLQVVKIKGQDQGRLLFLRIEF